MNGKHYIGKRVSSLDLYDELGPITGVALVVDDENEFFSGDETGYVLEMECPYATQTMADNVLASVQGKTYKGFRAQDAKLGIDSELGDGVTVNGTYSLLAYQMVSFGGGHVSEIAAPGENTVDHEYPYVSPTQREIQRNRAQAYSLITKTAEEIRLEVATENQKTAASIEALEKQFDADLSELSDEITETLTSYSTITQTSESIAAAVETSKTYTDTKTGEVVAKLENYSTIEQTASKIATAVSESKSYTDTEIEALEKEFSSDLGNLESAINVKFESYSTTEQTASKIASAVSESKTYTDTKTGEVVASLSNYSTVEQTASKISSAVSESKTYTDTKTGEVITLLDSYSTIEQTSSKISAAVSGLVNGDTVQSMIDTSLEGIELTTSDSNGSTTFTLKSGTATLCSDTFDLHVKAANIYGTLSVEQINMTGAITWDYLASDAQTQVNNAASAASAAQSTADSAASDANAAWWKAYQIANGTYSGGSFIDGKNIYSPNLYGDTINLLDGSSNLVGTMSLQSKNTDAFDIDSVVSIRLTAAAGYNAFMGVTDGPGFTAYGETGHAAIAGKLQLTSKSFGYNLPDTGEEEAGQVYFLLQS